MLHPLSNDRGHRLHRSRGRREFRTGPIKISFFISRHVHPNFVKISRKYHCVLCMLVGPWVPRPVLEIYFKGGSGLSAQSLRRPAQTRADPGLPWGARFDAQTLPQCGYAMYMIYVSWLRQKTELEKLLMVPNTVREDVAQIESSLALVKLVLNH